MAKRFLYTSVHGRKLSPPQLFNNIEEARQAMRNDFIQIIGNDVIDNIFLKEFIDLRDINTHYTEKSDCEFGITRDYAWIDARSFSDGNWDAKIFLVSF